MLSRFALCFSNLLQRLGRWNLLIKVLVFLAIFLPLCVMIYGNYRENLGAADALVFSRRAAVTQLASTLLQHKFESIIDLGMALTAQPNIQTDIQNGDWQPAIEDLANTQKHLDYIDSLVLFSPDGTLQSIWPPAPEVVGMNFSYRDYYIGVTSSRAPYVSEVFKRAAIPHYNISAIAIPIFPYGEHTSEADLIGILVITVKLDTILEWSKEVDVGQDGFIYFTDQHGNLAGHPTYSINDTVVNFSTVPEVSKGLQGQNGVEISYNPIDGAEYISGYQPVEPFGWVTVAQQSSDTAFAFTNAAIEKAFLQNCVLGILSATLLAMLIHLLFTVQAYYQKERILVESIGDGLIGIDRSWNITLWNRAAERLTGWTKEEALGKPFRQIVKFINESSKEEDIRFIEETMLFGTVRFMAKQTVLKQKNGNEISVGDSASPVFNENGAINGAIIIFRDISKDRELEKGREEFASLATHQLRTPITTINSYTELLADTNLAPDQKEEVAAIRQASAALNQLVNSMLNVSRIESGKLDVNPEPLYVPDIILDEIKLVTPEADAKKLKLQANIADNVPSINADKKLLTAICNNLFSNAVKYTPEHGTVTVSVSKDDHNLLLSVADTGVGIPASDQPKIFTKFFRADNVKSSGISGTGLGLHIVKAILNQTGGKIWLESTVGVGSTFYVSIPLSGMERKAGIKGLT